MGSDMRFGIVIVLFGLAGCSLAAVAPQPVDTRLSRSALTVGLADGSMCRGDLAGVAPWVGTLPDCGLAYVVTPTAGGSPIRLGFEALVSAARLGDYVAPMAEIALTDQAGRVFAFASPVLLED